MLKKMSKSNLFNHEKIILDVHDLLSSKQAKEEIYNFLCEKTYTTPIFDDDDIERDQAILGSATKDISLSNSKIRCKNCNSKEIMIFEKQTRSGDEGATIFMTCNNCKTKWRSN